MTVMSKRILFASARRSFEEPHKPHMKLRLQGQHNQKNDRKLCMGPGQILLQFLLMRSSFVRPILYFYWYRHHVADLRPCLVVHEMQTVQHEGKPSYLGMYLEKIHRSEFSFKSLLRDQRDGQATLRTLLRDAYRCTGHCPHPAKCRMAESYLL